MCAKISSFTKNIYVHNWVFPKIGVPQNGWFIMENPIKMDDLGVLVPLFLETPNCEYIPLPVRPSDRQTPFTCLGVGDSPDRDDQNCRTRKL